MSRRLLALYCALLLLLPACKQGGEAGQSGNGEIGRASCRERV